MGHPYRYYVSCAYLDTRGAFGLSSIDWSTSTPIRTADDLTGILGWFTERGYENPKILSFSRYDEQAN